MQFSTFKRSTLAGVLAAAQYLSFAGEPEQPKPPVAPPPPVQPPPVQPQPVKPAPVKPRPAIPGFNVNLQQMLNDFQGADQPKQDAAAVALLEAGSRGYNMLNILLKNPNADIVKRANELRAKIEENSKKVVRGAVEKHQEIQKHALTLEILQDMYSDWIYASNYAVSPLARQNCSNNGAEVQKQIKEVSEALQKLQMGDLQLKGDPIPQGTARAAIQVERGNAFKTLNRNNEGLEASNDAIKASGKDGRLISASLKLKGEFLERTEDTLGLEEVCNMLLNDYPKTLEARYAYTTLISLKSGKGQWDEAVSLAKKVVMLATFDETAQDEAFGVMNSMMDEAHDYTRTEAMGAWLIENLPIQRLNGDVPRRMGGIYEYVKKDYAAALKNYTILAEKFPDMIEPEDMQAVLNRVKVKVEGKFPKEASETDQGPAGVLAKFLKAVRAGDAKAAGALVPSADSQAFIENIGEFLPGIVFADYIVKKVEIDAKGEQAAIILDYYEASAETPKKIKEMMVNEKGAWKVQWADPDESELEEEAPPEPAKTEPEKKEPEKK